MECIRGKTSAEIGLAPGVAGYGDVLIDVGTGDGRYVLHVARTRPTWFAVGVDACRDNRRVASRKAPGTLLDGGKNGGSKPDPNSPWRTE